MIYYTSEKTLTKTTCEVKHNTFAIQNVYIYSLNKIKTKMNKFKKYITCKIMHRLKGFSADVCNIQKDSYFLML